MRQFKIGTQTHNADSIQVPRLTQAELDASVFPVGSICYNTDTDTFTIFTDEGANEIFKPSYFETPVTKLSDLPAPVGGIIQLEDNITYRFKGLINIGVNQIRLGISNTLFGFDKSDDGLIYTGVDSCIIGTNQTATINAMTIVAVAGKHFDITNNLSQSIQIRECIFSGNANGLGTINGSLVFAFNNNIIGDMGDLVITGTFQKVGIATNYWLATTNFTNLVHFDNATADTLKVIDNDFVVHVGKVGVRVTNSTINANGGGSVISNTFSGGGDYIVGITPQTLDWIIEANGRDILSTSDTLTQRKVRSEEELDLYLSLPDPTRFSYLLDAEEFLITKPIEVPGSGVNGGLTFFGLGNNFTTLKTVTPGIAMFSGGGNLFLNDMVITAEGVGSSVFAMVSATNFEAVEMINVNFQFCESLGFLDGFRQGLLINGFMIGDKQGLECRGTWSGGFRISDSRFIFTPTVGSYMFKGAIGQTFGSRFATNANVTIGTGSIGYDFTPDNFLNDANFQIIDSQFSGGGTYINGITASSIKSLWRDSPGVDDTFPGVVYRSLTDQTTTINTVNVYEELLIDNNIVEDVWFESQSLTTFHARYVSTLPINVRIDVFLALQSGNNNELQVEIRKYDSTNTTFVSVDQFKMTSNGGALGTRIEPIALASFTRLLQNERIRIFVRNITGSTNVLAEEASKLIISKR